MCAHHLRILNRMMDVLRALVTTADLNFTIINKDDQVALAAAVFLGPNGAIDQAKISYIPHHLIGSDGANTAQAWAVLMAITRDAEIDAHYSEEELDNLGPVMRDGTTCGGLTSSSASCITYTLVHPMP